MDASYVMGLDLGPPGEPTGFAILEEPAADVAPPEPTYNLRHLERFPPVARTRPFSRRWPRGRRRRLCPAHH